MPGKPSQFYSEHPIWINSKHAEVKAASLVRKTFRKELSKYLVLYLSHMLGNSTCNRHVQWLCDIEDLKPKAKPSDVQTVREYFY